MRRGKGWFTVMVLMAGIGVMGVAQVQTPSVTLFTVIQKIQENPYVPEKQEIVLAAFFAAAVEQGGLSPEQALTLLDTVGWDELTQEGVGFAVRTLELALIAITAGDMTYEEVLATLTQGWASWRQTGAPLPGLFVALSKSAEGMSPELWAQVEELVLDEVPPGIVARTLRQCLRSGASEEEILEALEDLREEVAEGMPPGKAANKAASLNCNREKERNREEEHNWEEENKSSPQEVRGDHQNREEEEHGKSHGHGKGKGS